jgi:hypothetical protein
MQPTHAAKWNEKKEENNNRERERERKEGFPLEHARFARAGFI